MKSILLKITLLSTFVLFLTSCNRTSVLEDDIPQEEISNALLLITDDADGSSAVYNYQINGSNVPNIKLKNGHEYTVQISLKNGSEDINQEIIDAKDEHYFIFDFPNSNIELTRIDNASSTRTDGNKVGLTTKWKVNNAANNANAQLILTLYHESISATENAVASGTGFVYGTQSGGETDMKVNYLISDY
jgi:hypothetical protein